jgi:hypothetical protein
MYYDVVFRDGCHCESEQQIDRSEIIWCPERINSRIVYAIVPAYLERGLSVMETPHVFS